MSQLLVDDIVNKDDTGAPGLSRGVVVTGITTSTSAVIGTGVTINSTGIEVAAGIVTASSAVVGAAVTINSTGVDAGAGILTATTLKATTLDATTVNATTLTGSGANLTGLPAGFNWVDGSLF